MWSCRCSFGVKKPTETVLRSLNCVSFRNLRDTQVEWCAGLNVITGDNGHGKTNLLEACFFLAMGRSFRTARVDALPRRGSSFFSLSGEVSHRQVSHFLGVKAGRGLRERTLDGRQSDLGRTLEVMACLVFAAPRLALFRGGPDDRRRFLDRGIVGGKPGMVETYRDHLRALRHKNRLLKEARQGRPVAALREQLAAFNDQLAGTASTIRHERQDYVNRLGKVLALDEGPAGLVPGKRPEIVYRPHPTLEDGMTGSREDLLAAYQERADDEIRRGHALVGPQRDDLFIHQDGAEMSRFASAGQQRAALIALKMSKMLVHKEMTGSYPVLLVDDVDAELDADRTRRALHLLTGPYQVLVASASVEAWAGDPRVALHLRVRDGIISRFS